MVAVLTIIETHPGKEDVWQTVWKQLSDKHRQSEGFRAARLLQDLDKSERYVVLSEWESREDYDRFVRHMGVSWLDDALQYAKHPYTVMVMEERAP